MIVVKLHVCNLYRQKKKKFLTYLGSNQGPSVCCTGEVTQRFYILVLPDIMKKSFCKENYKLLGGLC